MTETSRTERVPATKSIERTFLVLLLFVPISLSFGLFTRNGGVTFLTAILALAPLARIIGYATKEIVLQTNPAFGGLINATFGNLIELLIAILALRRGLTVVVKASIIGSIIGNILLLTGISLFAGGIRYREQRFNKASVGVSSTMLIIAVVGLAMPTVYSLASDGKPEYVSILSDAVAVIMALAYVAGLIFAYFTHKDLFDASDEIRSVKEKPTLTKKSASILLFLATVVAAVESNFLVEHVEFAASSLGLTQTFVGVVVIAIVTNIAEKANAVHFALQDKIDISLEIGLSSAIQIALFVVPILILVSEVCGYGFSLVFSTFEIISMVFAVMIVNYLSADGKCNWLEGVQLVTVYLIIAIAFFFI